VVHGPRLEEETSLQQPGSEPVRPARAPPDEVGPSAPARENGDGGKARPAAREHEAAAGPEAADYTDAEGGSGGLTIALVGLLALVRGLMAVWAGEQEGLQAVRLFQRARRIAVPHASAGLESANQGRLVHVQGLTATAEVLRDPLFGIEVKDALKLRRKVEMFQWTEHAETVERDLPGGGKEQATTYSYRTGWHPVPVESWRFQGHQGPRHSNPQMPIISEELWAREATLGKFRLPTRLVGQVCKYTPCTELAPESAGLTVEHGGHKFTQAVVEGTLYLVSRGAAAPPEIGDLRVRFERAPCEEVSVLAVQAEDAFRPMKVTDRIDSDGRICFDEEPDPESCGCTGLLCCLPGRRRATEAEQEEVFMVTSGRKTARQMLWTAEGAMPRPRRWPNLSGLLCTILGLGLLGSVVPGAFQAIPYAGRLIESFGLVAVWATALVLGAATGYATAALAWFQARPCRALLWLFAAAAVGFAPYLYRYWQSVNPAVA